MPYAYEGGICTEARAGAIEISQAQYDLALEAILDGKVITTIGGFKITDPPAFPDLDPDAGLNLDGWKIKLLTKIDIDAETARLRYITGGSGQAMTYQQKSQEAAAALVDPFATVEKYPLLAAEIGITAPTLSGVASVVDAAYQNWRVVGGAIEALRLGGKASVTAAATIEDAKQAADIIWP